MARSLKFNSLRTFISTTNFLSQFQNLMQTHQMEYKTYIWPRICMYVMDRWMYTIRLNQLCFFLLIWAFFIAWKGEFVGSSLFFIISTFGTCFLRNQYRTIYTMSYVDSILVLNVWVIRTLRAANQFLTSHPMCSFMELIAKLSRWACWSRFGFHCTAYISLSCEFYVSMQL